ncbi:MAG: LysM peptidoglycan-binding domain-containing protein, partial [Chloroflexi bacterium]|nr:LysM peptidoglycan-binding domain-containing protein [Chloroflexota bacterium]
MNAPDSWNTTRVGKPGPGIVVLMISLGGGVTTTADPLYAAQNQTPTPAGMQAGGCNPDTAWIESPGDADYLPTTQPVTVLGTANIPDFGGYRFEIKPAALDVQYLVLAEGAPFPIVEDTIQILDFSGIPPGEYRLRLVVFDSSMQPGASCEITVFVGLEPPVSDPAGETAQAVDDWYQVFFTTPGSSEPSAMEGALVDTIDGAQVSIDAALFELSSGPVTQALIRAHNRGVAVRVVTDGLHGLGIDDDSPSANTMSDLVAAGIPVVSDEMRGGFMHNKFLIIDGQTVWTGSANPTENGFAANNNGAILIQSQTLAQNYTAEFEELYAGQFGRMSPAGVPYPVIDINGTLVETYFLAEDGDAASQRLGQLIGNASQLEFALFSFTSSVEIGDTGENLMGLIADRVASGELAGRGVIEARSSRFAADLACAGMPLRTDGNPGAMHHKILVIDEAIVVIGSANLSNNSFTENDENLLIIPNPDIARLYLDEIERLWAQGQELSLDDLDCPQAVAVAPVATPTQVPPLLQPTPTAQSPGDSSPCVYTVQAGDTLYSIARQFVDEADVAVFVDALLSLNGISDSFALQVGQELRIPGCEDPAATTSDMVVEQPTLDPGAPQNAEVLLSVPTVQPTPTPVGTVLPGAPSPVGCSRDSASFYIPGDGVYLFQPITAYGTANIPGFATYRFEIKPANDPNAQFALLSQDYTVPVVEGPLGIIDTTGLAYDEYRLRLAVFDNTRSLRAACEITIHIGPPPTQPAVSANSVPCPAHVVQPGDTLYAIAVTYAVTLPDLMEYNNLGDTYFLQVGDVLLIPCEVPEAAVLAPTPTPYSAPEPAGDRYLVIPSLSEFEQPVPIQPLPLEGGTWDVSTLRWAVGWLEGTTWLEPDWGNTVLAAHRQFNFDDPGPFYNLDQLQPGDEI